MEGLREGGKPGDAISSEAVQDVEGLRKGEKPGDEIISHSDHGQWRD